MFDEYKLGLSNHNMDFLDPHKKRANLIRLYIGYALMAVAITIGTIIVLYSSFGYGVDRHTGKVIQNGLVFLSSSPDGASIEMVDSKGKRQPESKTNTRMTIPAAQYEAKLTKPGYRSWQRSFELEGGSVERLMYPLLIPETLTLAEVQLYPNQPQLITGSPDRHWILVLRPDSQTEFEVFDASKKAPTGTVAAMQPSLLSPGANQSLKVVEWSTNNKHVLLQHNFDTTKEFILFNFENPAESLNVNKHFGISADEVLLYDKSPNELFILSGGLLQKASVKDKQLAPLITHVVSFKPHGTDMIEYISSENSQAANKVTLHLRNNDKDYLVRDFPAGTSYMLDLAKFDNRWYVVAGAASENKIFVYEDPLHFLENGKLNQNISVRTLRVDTPIKALFSANARFISVQGVNQNFTVYDAEYDRQYRYVIDRPLDIAYPASWMDGHRLVSVSEGKAIMFDFDGNNLQSLIPANSGTTPLFDRDYETLYTLGSARAGTTGFVLSRTNLRVDN